MKKPNITEGEWKIKRSEDLNNKWHRIATIGNREIVSFHGHPYGTAIDNAKAISAVPGMIDALIEFVNNHTVNTTSDMRRHKRAKKALEKAGVEL